MGPSAPALSHPKPGQALSSNQPGPTWEMAGAGLFLPAATWPGHHFLRELGSHMLGHAGA